MFNWRLNHPLKVPICAAHKNSLAAHSTGVFQLAADRRVDLKYLATISFAHNGRWIDA